jgi:predicted TIM-barrel fold metal-dependent hydrolase
MNTFDFNIHFPCELQKDTNKNIANDNSMILKDLEFCYENYKSSFKKSFSSANFMIFNQNIFDTENLTDFILKVKSDFPNSIFTNLTDFRKSNVFEYLEVAKSQGVQSVKFHSYNQKIGSEDFGEVLKVAKFAEELGMILNIDTSYGSSKMYSYNNIKLASYISDFVTRTPIVLLHSGGAKVLEAMLLAEEKKNIFLETSFSVPYYIGSSIEQDLAFAYKKIGVERVLYGSDAPYIDLGTSKEVTLNFLEKHSFLSKDIDKILYQNSINIL